MSERTIDGTVDTIPEIDDLLEKAMLCMIEDARAKLDAGDLIPPTTGLIMKDVLVAEEHSGDNEDDFYNASRHTVQNASGATGYVFCYDGYINIDGEDRDVIIAEGGMPGQSKGIAVGQLYLTGDDGSISYEGDPVYIGTPPNFMEFTSPVAIVEEDDEDADLLEEEEEQGPIPPEEA